jgi:hypothetical protein
MRKGASSGSEFLDIADEVSATSDDPVTDQLVSMSPAQKETRFGRTPT